MTRQSTILFLSLLLFIFAAWQCNACICERSEYNFYRNLHSNQPILFAVMDSIYIGYGNDEWMETGVFRVIDVISGSEFVTADTVLIFGSNGLNCGEYLSQFSFGDSLFLSVFQNFSGEQNHFFIDGCDRNYLLIKNGESTGLSIPQIIRKINSSIDQTTRCGCGILEWVFDFYDNIERDYVFCLAEFIGYDYAVEEENRLFQTGHFIVLDAIGNFTSDVGSEIVAIGENGINCGEMFGTYQSGDTLILALETSPLFPVSPDTFFLTGRYCGSHALPIQNGRNDDKAYSEIRAEICSVIHNYIPVPLLENECLVYPNPFQSEITFCYSGEPIYEMEIFDSKGRLMLKDDGFSMHRKSFSLASYPKGIFYAKVRTSMGLYTQKIVKVE
ncbi:MAG TPA: T9SS type A sorting domain-containing protein [Prolixibacteraceae bacterium]|nr:T9SS type A sorting domain-containing protein [Prolixibacteraceae bacterium]